MQILGAGTSFRVGLCLWILSASLALLLSAGCSHPLSPFLPPPPFPSVTSSAGLTQSSPENHLEPGGPLHSWGLHLHPAPGEEADARGGVGGSPEWTLMVADGESREPVEAERGRLRGWRKQSPQLSAEEGGDNAGAGESSTFKAVQPWRTPTPFALGGSLPGPALAAPPPPPPGSAGCRSRSKRIPGSPSPSRSYPARGVHAAALLRVAPLFGWVGG